MRVLGTGLLAALAYVPLLCTKPGILADDTTLVLFAIARAPRREGAG